MSGINHLLTLAHKFARAENLELSTVSWRVFGDTKKLGALEAGADIQVGRYEKAILWFSENWPSNVEWPKAIDRPVAERAAS